MVCAPYKICSDPPLGGDLYARGTYSEGGTYLPTTSETRTFSDVEDWIENLPNVYNVKDWIEDTFTIPSNETLLPSVRAHGDSISTAGHIVVEKTSPAWRARYEYAGVKWWEWQREIATQSLKCALVLYRSTTFRIETQTKAAYQNLHIKHLVMLIIRQITPSTRCWGISKSKIARNLRAPVVQYS
jgi:hypothetical protein